MSQRGELNLGQLVRERHGQEGFSVGFTTYAGTVTAASDWGSPAERMQVRPGLQGSYETLFHEVGIPRFLLPLQHRPNRGRLLPAPLLERAIGVIYRPETERWSHYFDADLPRQFDAVIHFDQSRAVESLERTPEWEREAVPETYPSGL
jgi:erythromycin esterase-like protein